jgi:methylmalonyl-CoA mutase cobalamin-binding subunit
MALIALTILKRFGTVSVMEISDSIPRHPIRVVAQRTGLTAATIRAWERRYAAVRPTRSEGGQRLYSDQDIERLDTLRGLTEAGRQISSVAGLPPADAAALLLEDRMAAAPAVGAGGAIGPATRVDEAFRMTLGFDSEGLERLLWRSALSLGGRAFLDDVLAPLLRRIGSGGADGEVSPSQEHLASSVIDQVLERLSSASRTGDGPSLVVSTLPGERHGLGARLVSAAAVLEGWRVRYLGTDLPVPDIVAAADGVGAAAVAISVVGREDIEGTQATLLQLREMLDSRIDLLVGGRGARGLDPNALPGVWIHDGLDRLPPPPSKVNGSRGGRRRT